MINMFSPVQIKHECIGVEDVNQSGRIVAQDDSKYPIFINQDIEYRFRPLPQFWDHSQVPSDHPVKNDVHGHQGMLQMETSVTAETGSLSCMKDYLQNGVLFQLNQHQGEVVSQTQINEQCQPNLPLETHQTQMSQDVRHARDVNPALTMGQSTTVKPSRPGRPPKGATDANVGKKLKCQCEICFKEFGHKSNLFIHMRTHNGERPYKCSQCEKCFTHSGNLAIHMRTHSGERPYGCQICGKMFSHSGNLSTHLRTHSGVKPYKCSICAKEFRHSGNLSIHERIHSGIKPFHCKVCGKDFYHSGNLTTHMKKHAANTNTNTNTNSSQCENSGGQVLGVAGDHSVPSPLTSLKNIAMAPIDNDVKLIHDMGNDIPVKNECSDDSVSINMAILTSTSS